MHSPNMVAGNDWPSRSNIKSKAVPVARVQVRALLADYQALKEFWAVEPHLETLLKVELAAVVSALV